ncbi:MAG: hypothetical protein DRJ50_04025 [Actinobacteria bacterium]|nr:MAG: hypothetical protein DRJ50_04025 [Actinomycetota bacterium]
MSATVTEVKAEVLEEMYLAFDIFGAYDDEYRKRIAGSMAHNMVKLGVVRTKYDHFLSRVEKQTLGEIGEQVAGYFKVHVDDDGGLLAAIRERQA